MDWNAAVYLQFEKERTQPAIDLANRIELDDPKRIIDIGCGPGNSTHVLVQKYPNAYVLGADHSADMLETARATYPDYHFALLDITKDTSAMAGEWDIVFSNTCIQWVANHHQLVPNMLKMLKPGGVLAIQLPMNFELEFYKIIAKVSISDRWQGLLGDLKVFHNLEQGEYFDLLRAIAPNFCMWETTYIYAFQSHADILRWYRGALMLPYLNRLNDAQKELFEQDIMTRVAEQYPVHPGGAILFRFPRLFFVATHP